MRAESGADMPRHYCRQESDPHGAATGTAGAVSYDLKDYDFEYPEECVATEPAEPRDSSRLLVLDRARSGLAHASFAELPRWFKPGDCLVLNRSKVLPALLVGSKPTGGKVALLLVRELEPGLWAALATGLKPGVVVRLPGDAQTTVEPRGADGHWRLRFSTTDVASLMLRHGRAPLPPYIAKRRKGREHDAARDRERYQTVYAKEEGSIAAPTAGLHFTPELLQRLASGGVQIAEVTLHVGLGTFLPMTSADVRGHAMLPERYVIGDDALNKITAAREGGSRVVAVGTTAVRTLESWAATGKAADETRIFIHPGREFRCVDAMVTNFHQPRSTPLLLASAFAGRERLLAAYREAFSLKYRLFSYGDAMLIL